MLEPTRGFVLPTSWKPWQINYNVYNLGLTADYSIVQYINKLNVYHRIGFGLLINSAFLSEYELYADHQKIKDSETGYYKSIDLSVSDQSFCIVPSFD